MNFKLRKATLSDRAEIEQVIAESVRGLGRGYYTEEQIELSIKTVFGIDIELIEDGTYFVAETEGGKIIGCGGWGRRKTLFGASRFADSRDSAELDPRTDAAKIRAFFIHPDWARKGIGKAILKKCEDEAKAFGFTSAEMMSTLPGVRFYEVCGYSGDERVNVPIGENIEIPGVRMSKKLT